MRPRVIRDLSRKGLATAVIAVMVMLAGVTAVMAQTTGIVDGLDPSGHDADNVGTYWEGVNMAGTNRAGTVGGTNDRQSGGDNLPQQMCSEAYLGGGGFLDYSATNRCFASLVFAGLARDTAITGANSGVSGNAAAIAALVEDQILQDEQINHNNDSYEGAFTSLTGRVGSTEQSIRSLTPRVGTVEDNFDNLKKRVKRVDDRVTPAIDELTAALAAANVTIDALKASNAATNRRVCRLQAVITGVLLGETGQTDASRARDARCEVL